MKIGDLHKEDVYYTQDQVDRFAEITGDRNPIHLDASFAALTIFKKPIIHGFLSSSIFSKIIGTVFPGEGSIYLMQNMKFLKPMYVNSLYEVVIEIVDIRSEKKHIHLKTTIYEKASDTIVLDGLALVYFPNYH